MTLPVAGLPNAEVSGCTSLPGSMTGMSVCTTASVGPRLENATSTPEQKRTGFWPVCKFPAGTVVMHVRAKLVCRHETAQLLCRRHLG